MFLLRWCGDSFGIEPIPSTFQTKSWTNDNITVNFPSTNWNYLFYLINNLLTLERSQLTLLIQAFTLNKNIYKDFFFVVQLFIYIFSFKKILFASIKLLFKIKKKLLYSLTLPKYIISKFELYLPCLEYNFFLFYSYFSFLIYVVKCLYIIQL